MNSRHTIEFYYEEIDFTFPEEESTKQWIRQVLTLHDITSSELSYIFCTDDYLLKINQDYLNHDYYTDIITFPLEVTDDTIQSDLFISIDRVKENATTNTVTFKQELLRVIVHGLLHLLGYGDKTPEEEAAMRNKEDEMLSLSEDKE